MLFEESGWVNKIITAGIIAMIGWTLLTVQDMSIRIAVLDEQLTGVRQTLTASVADRYSRSEAIADRAVMDQRILRLEQWAERLSNRVNAAEDTVSKEAGRLDAVERAIGIEKK